MSRHLVVEAATGLIVNSIEFDGTTPWVPPDGHSVVQSNAGEVDGTKPTLTNTEFQEGVQALIELVT